MHTHHFELDSWQHSQHPVQSVQLNSSALPHSATPASCLLRVRLCCRPPPPLRLALPRALVSFTLTVADDHQALIWDIQQMPRAIEDPILAYTAEGEINNVQWASTQPDWIAICYNNCLEILRV